MNTVKTAEQPRRGRALAPAILALAVTTWACGGLAPATVSARQQDTPTPCAPGSPATPPVVAAAPLTPEALAWVPRPDIPRPRSELGAAVLDGRIYVVGGFGGGSAVDCFDVAANAWAPVADLPISVHHPGVAALDGRLYVAGGYTDAGGDSAALWAYDPASDVWERRADMPTARGALGLAALDGRLYAVGGALGFLGGLATDAVEAYDPGTDTWERRAPLPTPREHLAVAAGAGRVFAVGGRANGDEGDPLASAAEAYDPTADRWETLPPLPTPRGGVSGVFAADQLLVLGGERGPTTYADVEAYDPTTRAWTALPPLPIPLHGLATAAVGDTVYALTGSTRAGAAENTAAVHALTLPPKPSGAGHTDRTKA